MRCARVDPRTNRASRITIASVSLLAFAFLANPTESRSATYYVAVNGSDTNNGLSASTPYQSVAKVSGLPLMPGDQVLFRKGDTFRGQLNLTRSGTAGNPIVFDAYGTGALPTLSGAAPIGNWTNIGNLWQAGFPAAASMVTGLYSNGVALPLGRWPNLATTNAGYLAADSTTGQTQLACAALATAPTNNWTGGEVVCRTMQWVLDRAAITSQTGNTLNFSFLFPSAYNVQPGWGFFIQNHVATLDQPGEWCFNNATRTLTLYASSDPNSWLIEATLTGTVINLLGAGTISNVTIRNLQVSGGLQQNIHAQNATNLILSNVQVINAGQDGLVIDGSGGGGITITNCVFSHINNNAINMMGTYPGYAIRGCTFTDIATAAGRGAGGDNQMNAFFQWSSDATPGTLSVIDNNIVDGAGYIGFYFHQSNIAVSNNVVRNYDLVKDDGGGIYTYNDQYPLPLTNQYILKNVVYNAIGATNGVVNYYPGAIGIYLDGHSRYVVVASNTVFNCAGHGFLLNNDVSNVTVTANTLFSNGNQLSVNQRNHGDTITGNIFFCKYQWQTAAKILNDNTDVSDYGVIDTNYYCRPFDDILTLNFNQNWQMTVDLPLSGWQALFGKDLHSLTSPITYPPYLTNSVGANLIANGTFNSDINGWGVYAGFSNNVTAAWDNPGKLTGGCLKLQFSSPSGNIFNTLNAFNYGTLFSVTNGTVYLLSFDAVGSAQNRAVRALLLQNNPPWINATAPTRGVMVGTNRMHFQIFLPAVATVSSARLQWELDEGSDQSTVWLDNIQLSVASVAAVNPDDCIRFEYNPTPAPKAVFLTSSYVDVKGNHCFGNLTVPPFSSVVLLKSDPPVATSITQPAPGNVSLQWSGVPGKTYQVLTSTNLLDWGLLGSFAAGADGVYSMLDTNAWFSKRFYRSSSLP